jgi:hypothetical protein
MKPPSLAESAPLRPLSRALARANPLAWLEFARTMVRIAPVRMDTFGPRQNIERRFSGVS